MDPLEPCGDRTAPRSHSTIEVASDARESRASGATSASKAAGEPRILATELVTQRYGRFAFDIDGQRGLPSESTGTRAFKVTKASKAASNPYYPLVYLVYS